MAFINGDYVAPAEAKISIFDLGFVRSDVVYDVVSTWAGMFFRLDDHIERFFASVAGIGIDPPYGPGEVRRILANCVERAGLENAYVSMATTRGQYRDPAKRDPRDCIPTFIAFAIPYVWIASPEVQDKGLAIAVPESRRIPDSAIDQRFKNYHWGDLTRGLRQALDSGADTAVLCTPEGDLAEGPGFNLFLAKDGRLKTPEKNVLRGITRRSVMELAAELGVPLEAGRLSKADLLDADEAFLTSTAGGIMPVTRVDERIMSNDAPGPLSRQFRQLYWQKREAGWHGTPVRQILA